MAKINEKELKEIFLELRSNKETAFEKLYTNYNKMVYGIAFGILKNKQDSEDIVQAVFTKIYQLENNKLPTDKEASWLYTITKNQAITLLRKKNNNLDIESIYEIADEDNDINNVINQDSYNRLISKLNSKEKEILSLKVISNLSFEQIGKLLNEPTGTVKWRYYKATNTLRLILSNLAVLIFTLVIGAKVLSNKNEKQENIKEEQITEDTIINEQESTIQEENKAEQSNREEQDKCYGDELQNEVEEEKQEIVQDIETNDIDYTGIGALGLSVAVLIITIIILIFFKKYQLKRKRKASK